MAEQTPHVLSGVGSRQREQDRDRLRSLPDRRICWAAAGVDGLARGVDQLHRLGHRDVEAEGLQGKRRVMQRAVGDLAQLDITGRRIGAGSTRDVLGDAPGAGQKLLGACGRDIRPVDVILRWAGEDHRETDRIDTVDVELIRQLHQVAARLAHRRAVHDDHALVEQAGEGLGEIDHSHVEHHLGEEATVEQVQDRVGHAADVLVDRHPLLRRVDIEGTVCLVRVEVAHVVPGRVDEGVHRVGVALRIGPAAPRTCDRGPLGGGTQRG